MSGTQLSHLFVHVADLAASRAFYVERLGLTVLAEEPGYRLSIYSPLGGGPR